ncbi:hypothetical protein RRG08_037968 [Elysia crispata]|uniref:Uncharacterized protein n=1 Tax=Elysia crispata TaxID=231223 RepID=A0AAE1AD21_9GAST|nr:hypothetical protein RRG08_037968 [Elysia crispata]
MWRGMRHACRTDTGRELCGSVECVPEPSAERSINTNEVLILPHGKLYISHKRSATLKLFDARRRQISNLRGFPDALWNRCVKESAITIFAFDEEFELLGLRIVKKTEKSVLIPATRRSNVTG